MNIHILFAVQIILLTAVVHVISRGRSPVVCTYFYGTEGYVSNTEYSPHEEGQGQLWGIKMRSRLLLQFPDTGICQASNFYYTYLSVLYTEILTKMCWDNNS